VESALITPTKADYEAGPKLDPNPNFVNFDVSKCDLFHATAKAGQKREARTC